MFTFSRSSTGTHVERRDDVRAAIDAVLAETDHIDFVVNTAAVLPRGDLVDTSEETVYAATEINYLAPVLLAQEFFPHLRATRGSMLNFTSSSYTRGRRGYSLYSSAKAAMVNLTQALADEWSRDGVRGQLRQPRAHRHPDAHPGVRRGAAGLAAGVDRGRAPVDGRPDQRRDRPDRRHPQGRPAVSPGAPAAAKAAVRQVGGRPLARVRRARQQPVLSVVMPVYDVADYLARGPRQRALPDPHELEVVAVDDGSTDGCLEILRDYERRDFRVRVLTQPNAGQGVARNLGVEHARGEFLTFFDSDDTLPPDAYADDGRGAAWRAARTSRSATCAGCGTASCTG